MAVTKWRSVNIIPLKTPVKIKSVKGIICVAKVCNHVRWIRRPDRQVPYRRILCRRLDGNNIGDIMAIGWVPLPDDDLTWKGAK